MQYYLMQYYGKMEKSTRDSLRVTWQGMQYYLMQYYGKMENRPRQFARTGHSITHTLIFVLEAIYEAVACADLGARVFFAYLSKGFDLVD